MKYCRILQNSYLNQKVQIFKDLNAERRKLVGAIEAVLLSLFGGDTSHNLNVLRYVRFARAINNIELNLARLLPTRDAIRYHTFRTYMGHR